MAAAPRTRCCFLHFARQSTELSTTSALKALLLLLTADAICPTRYDLPSRSLGGQGLGASGDVPASQIGNYQIRLHVPADSSLAISSLQEYLDRSTAVLDLEKGGGGRRSTGGPPDGKPGKGGVKNEDMCVAAAVCSAYVPIRFELSGPCLQLHAVSTALGAEVASHCVALRCIAARAAARVSARVSAD